MTHPVWIFISIPTYKLIRKPRRPYTDDLNFIALGSSLHLWEQFS